MMATLAGIAWGATAAAAGAAAGAAGACAKRLVVARPAASAVAKTRVRFMRCLRLLTGWRDWLAYSSRDRWLKRWIGNRQFGSISLTVERRELRARSAVGCRPNVPVQRL